jgi:diguanylate cyclase (GGDEF)-like protein
LFFLTYSLLPLFVFAFFDQKIHKGAKIFIYFGFIMIPVCFVLPQQKMLYWPLELAEITLIIPILMLLHLFGHSIRQKRPYAKSIASVIFFYLVLGLIDVWVDYTQSNLLSVNWLFGTWSLILISFTMTFLMAHKYRTYFKRATTDDLTSVLRRDEFILQLNKELQRSFREKKIMVILMVDLDDFKSINDRYGHKQGDDVLSMVTSALEKRLRLFDLIGRYGGDEFCIATGFDNHDEVKPFVERLNSAVNGLTYRVTGENQPISATFGAVVNQSLEKITAIELLEKADQLLIDAKNENKGGIVWS